MLSPATFQPFRQRHVAGETYPQRNVAGEKLMGRFPSDMSLGKGPFEFDFSTLFASIVLSFSGIFPSDMSLGKSLQFFLAIATITYYPTSTNDSWCTAQEKIAALVLTHADLDPLNNTGMSVEQLAQHFNGVHLSRHGFIFLGLFLTTLVGRVQLSWHVCSYDESQLLPVLLEAMTRVNYFVWNQRRAHDTEGVKITFLVILPPPSGQVIQTYSDADTMLQFMGVIAFDVGPPVFLFHMVGGNLAPGALRGRGRGRGAVAVLSGTGGRCSGGCESTCKAARAPRRPRPRPTGPGKAARAPQPPGKRRSGLGKTATAPRPRPRPRRAPGEGLPLAASNQKLGNGNPTRDTVKVHIL
ncbi:hypothetical protein Tco_1043935 [Tanacetum coccineum]|uniref:Uncharacterized protein n=1 Tax=Tanacetum coccineum TaxID=301880 RepID=A0ABQ5GNH9_9ASTR